MLKGARRPRKPRTPRPRRTPGRPLLAEIRRDRERRPAFTSVHPRDEVYVFEYVEPWPEPLPARC